MEVKVEIKIDENYFDALIPFYAIIKNYAHTKHLVIFEGTRKFEYKEFEVKTNENL